MILVRLRTGCSKLWKKRMHSSSTGHNRICRRDSSLSTSPTNTTNTDCRHRLNYVGIQMLPQFLRNKIFGDCEGEHVDQKAKAEIEKHLLKHDILGKKTIVRNVDEFELPPLHGENIDAHFRVIAEQQIKPYKEFADILVNTSLPVRPKHWIFKPGWTKYDSVSKTCYAVDFPDENVVVFDVEVLMLEGNYPTIATAVSPTSWYSWCSQRLFCKDVSKNSHVTTDDLIPLESRGQSAQLQNAHLVIGHNVGFDRTFVREQYMLKDTKTRFIDTMSLHIALSGLTGLQRVLFMANKSGSKRKEVKEHEDEIIKHGFSPSFEWTEESSLNNLNDVYQLYCKDAIPLQKHLRDIFVTGTIEDVLCNFQDLMSYCATDVKATYDIFRCMWPEFWVRFPHPVTFAGMMEMGLTYLPINENWQRYINASNNKYNEFENELNSILFQLAEDAVKLPPDSYRSNVWLWDLDWSLKKMRITKPSTSAEDDAEASGDNSKTNKRTKQVLSQPKTTYVSRAKWFADLCDREKEFKPKKISLQCRTAAKLLQLVWDGYPLHYDTTHGWGYLVPCINDIHPDFEADKDVGEFISPVSFPFNSLLKVCSKTKPDWALQLASVSEREKLADEILEKIQGKNGADEEDVSYYWEELRRLNNCKLKRPARQIEYLGKGPFLDVIPGCEFYKLPHKDGVEKRVGNPLAKDFMAKIEQGVLRSTIGGKAESVLKFGQMCSYWKNNVKRISSQMVVELHDHDLPLVSSTCSGNKCSTFLGAILPRVITAGTVTRRAVEQTWLTASNAYPDRVGSELKAMIQSPPGYHFVGADVDSQELWIAAVLGDANFHKVHGCTAFGWMTLQGTKSEETDLHSRTARLIGINRDQAKVFNYGRIYGAGQRFAERLLIKFNHELSQTEANKKARKLFLATKGRRVRIQNKPVNDVDEDKEGTVTEWQDGSESHMFNMLERIACSPEPRTPVLDCMISKALEPRNVKSEFMTSRVNWVVQSSAVDYLHLILVCMRWLIDLYRIDGRFCISIHDEVRYLVASDDRYLAAFALQVTNLLTRSLFAYKLGYNDLPLSVAFFSSVDIDTCLRKETSMDCVTPSNPLGLKGGYGISQGESIGMNDILRKMNNRRRLTFAGEDIDI